MANHFYSGNYKNLLKISLDKNLLVLCKAVDHCNKSPSISGRDFAMEIGRGTEPVSRSQCRSPHCDDLSLK